MSALLVRAVFESALKPNMKITAAALATFADKDGARIYPSLGRVGWMTGKTTRQVRRDVAEMVKLGVLEEVTERKGGRGLTTRYRFDPSALPQRPPWQKPGHGCPTLDEKPGHGRHEKADMGDTKGGHGCHETRTWVSADQSEINQKINQQLCADADALMGIWTRSKKRRDSWGDDIYSDWVDYGLDTNTAMGEKVIEEAREADHGQHPGIWLKERVKILKVLASIEAKVEEPKRFNCSYCGKLYIQGEQCPDAREHRIEDLWLQMHHEKDTVTPEPESLQEIRAKLAELLGGSDVVARIEAEKDRAHKVQKLVNKTMRKNIGKFHGDDFAAYQERVRLDAEAQVDAELAA